MRSSCGMTEILQLTESHSLQGKLPVINPYSLPSQVV